MQFVSAGVGIAREVPSTRVGQICIAEQVANNVRGIEPSFRIIRGQESDRAEPIFLILPCGSKSCLRLVPKVVRLLD